VDREEVRPLHQREAAAAEGDGERQLRAVERERCRAKRERDQHQAEQGSGAAHLGQLLRVDPRTEDDLRDGAVDREERRGERDHRGAERRTR
jgi:hypothetical protein